MKKYLYSIVILAIAVIAIQAKDYNPHLRPEHSYLGQFIGEWNQIYQFLPGGKAKPSFGRGEAVVTEIMNGVNIQFHSKVKYELGEVESIMIIGYDDTKKKYFLLTYDSTGERPYTAFGDYDREKNIFTFKGKREFGNAGVMDLRTEISWDREDKFLYKIFMHNGLKEVNTITIAFVKK